MMTDQKKLFIDLRGQDDNLGDSLLRRGMLAHLRRDVPTHVLVGQASSMYTSALGLVPDDNVYTSPTDYYREAFHSAGKGIDFVLNAGEVSYSRWYAKRSLATLPIIERNRKGTSTMFGVGLKSAEGTWKSVVNFRARRCTSVYWRDDLGLRVTSIGSLMPDWGFSEGSRSPFDARPRTTLVVSIRGDRQPPTDVEVEAIRLFAASNNLSVIVLTQVLRDNASAATLARRLDARFIEWAETTSHADHEIVVRNFYRDAALVLSDRLHVLVAASTEGAAVASFSDQPSTKASQNFATIGVTDLLIDTRTMTASVVASTLDGLVSRASDTNERVSAAATLLREIAEEHRAG